MLPDGNVLIAFYLTLFAGLATGIGSALAFFAKKTNTTFLCASLGFSAGVMIYVSMIEIFQKSKEVLSSELGISEGFFITTISFFGGILLVALIDKCVPNVENPHETRSIEEMECMDIAFSQNNCKHLMRMGTLSALAIAIHNFPEGLATFTSSLNDPALGLNIAIAVAIHNVPEGIAVSVPIYFATGNKKKAFIFSFLSGLAEPIGAIVGYTILYPFFNPITFGILFAAVAGIMVFISLDELLPSAEKYGKHHLAIYSVIAGMMIMATSLLLFN